ILGVDQPTDRAIIASLIRAHQAGGAPLSVPARAGKRGHPPLFARTLFPEVLTVDEATEGLKRVVRSHERDIHRVEVDSPLIALNLNRPADYAAAISAAQRRARC
ncbi:MAG TPA: NTP transferase domain-containing protein, partial [Dehalococcoidia bacterium]|nr:NTP transferase domain-containing protein [Dehalococcoidia bacterium]